MPELPEVATVISILKEEVINHKIIGIDILREKNFIGDKDLLINKTIKSIEQIGKFIVFHLSDDIVFISHLRMEGKYFYEPKNTPLRKHDLVVFHLENNHALIYNDTRKFGTIIVKNEKNYLLEEPLKDIALDPFKIKEDDFIAKLKKSNEPIKGALMNQHIISGIGNIYADEILFASSIYPLTKANKLCEEDVIKILHNSKIILKEAINKGGSTIKSYHPKEGISGNFQLSLKAYGKENKPCEVCGAKIKRIKINGRSTSYCPICQKNNDKPLIVAISGAIASGKSTALTYLKDEGYKVLDADKITHQLYKNEKVILDLKAHFKNIKISNNQIDKSYLKDLLISDKSFKEEYEQYFYKIIKEYIKNIINNSKEKVLILEVPLLFKAHIDELVDLIFIVEVNKNKQKDLLATRNIDIESYLTLNKDYYKQEKKEKATAIIINDSDIASLKNKIQKEIIDKYLLR